MAVCLPNNNNLSVKKLTTILILFLTVYGHAQKLKITIYNTTGYDVDSVSIGDTYVGFIKKNDSIVVLNCHDLKMQDGIPYFPGASGIVRTRKIDKVDTLKNPVKLYGWCGTGVEIVDSGTYRFTLSYYENSDGYRLWWGRHDRGLPK